MEVNANALQYCTWTTRRSRSPSPTDRLCIGRITDKTDFNSTPMDFQGTHRDVAAPNDIQKSIKYIVFGYALYCVKPAINTFVIPGKTNMQN